MGGFPRYCVHPAPTGHMASARQLQGASMPFSMPSLGIHALFHRASKNLATQWCLSAPRNSEDHVLAFCCISSGSSRVCDFRWPLEKGEQSLLNRSVCKDRTLGICGGSRSLGWFNQGLQLERKGMPVCQEPWMLV